MYVCMFAWMYPFMQCSAMYGGGDRWAAWMMVMVELACATRSLSRIWGGLDYAWPASGTRDKLSLSVLFAALLHNILFLLPLPSYAYSLAYFVAFLCAFYQLRWWIERWQHLHGSSHFPAIGGFLVEPWWLHAPLEIIQKLRSIRPT